MHPIPLQKSEPAGWARFALVIAGTIALSVWGSPVLIPLTCSIFLFFLLEPAVRFLERYRVPRSLAAPSIVAVSVALLVAASIGTFNGLARMATRLPEYSSRLQERLLPLSGPASQIERSAQKLFATTSLPNDVQKVHMVANPFQDWFVAILSRISSALSILTQLLLIPLLSTFLLLEKSHFKTQFQSVAGRTLPLSRMASEMTEMLKSFFASNIVVALGTAAGFYALFSLLRLENAVSLALFAGFLNLIPIFGAPLGALPAIGQSILQFDTMYPIVAILLGSALFHFLVANIVIPKVVGPRININVTSATLGLLFWGWAWGIAGLLMAIPMVAAIRILLAAHPSTQRWADFIAQRPRNSVHAPVPPPALTPAPVHTLTTELLPAFNTLERSN